MTTLAHRLVKQRHYAYMGGLVSLLLLPLILESVSYPLENCRGMLYHSVLCMKGYWNFIQNHCSSG